MGPRENVINVLNSEEQIPGINDYTTQGGFPLHLYIVVNILYNILELVEGCYYILTN